MTSSFDLNHSIAQCELQMQRMGLKWKSNRVQRWLDAKGIKSCHFMDQADFDALASAIARFGTPEYIAAKLNLEMVMELTGITYEHPKIQAWLVSIDAINEGLTVEACDRLRIAIEKAYRKENYVSVSTMPQP